MAKLWAIALAAALAGPAAASEEGTTELKVTVAGMICPTECGAKVARALASLPGASHVKMVDYDKGVFCLSIDPKSEIHPADLQKSLGVYKVKKLEATLSGTLGLRGKQIILTAHSGETFAVVLPDADSCCAGENVPAKQGSKKEPCDDCGAAAAAFKARVQALAKDAKPVKVTGTLSECCEVSLSIASLEEPKRPAN